MTKLETLVAITAMLLLTTCSVMDIKVKGEVKLSCIEAKGTYKYGNCTLD